MHVCTNVYYVLTKNFRSQVAKNILPTPRKKEWDRQQERERERERILWLGRAKVSSLWEHISEGLTAVTDL